MATLNLSLFSKTLKTQYSTYLNPTTTLLLTHSGPFRSWAGPHSNPTLSRTRTRAALDGDYSSKRSSSNDPRETLMLPGCDYNHWLIVMEFPKDPAPTREQMIETYLTTLATVLGRPLSLSLSLSLC
ncbi:hypothetical protein TEA_004352 [Camellia sinensis var. sinensis]|uniref:MORF/ORRM1/DAG-like MORF domain-containing protein n=1 Tax=Camellia sinensis var. sinensis TaxID=542762 RepID=A0A4V3WQB8_CAMSN|nr:hypothetical protein TEA_004352 [Camellia sinensis var. sinensis]